MTNDEKDKLLQKMAMDLAVIANSVKAHDKTLYGNGQPGLESRVTKMEASKATLVALVLGGISFVSAAVPLVAFLLKK